MRSLKFSNGKIPEESDLIDLLRSGVKLRVKCIHTDIAGSEDPSIQPLLERKEETRALGVDFQIFIGLVS